MPSEKREFGDFGEKQAENFLLDKRYKILDKNFRIKNLGEIDIVAKKGDRIIFFEVKTRNIKYETFFPIETSINFKKKRNLKRICQLYLIDKKYPISQEWQADALFIKIGASDGIKIDHLENILWEEYY